MKKLNTIWMMLLVILSCHLPVYASSASHFLGYETEIVLTEGYAYGEAKLQDYLYNGEGSDVAVYDFYFEGTDAKHFAFHSSQSASNINNYTKLSRNASSPFYIFFELGLPAKVYQAELVVETQAGTFRSPLKVTVEDPITMEASSKSYFTNYKNTAEVKEGYGYRDISLQDNLYNGEGTAVAVHNFYLEGKDAEHFDFSSDYSAANINQHSSLSRGASTPFYLFFDLDMPAGVYSTDLVVVTAVGTYRSTYTVTVKGTTTTPSTGNTTTPSTGTTTTPSTGTTTTPSTGTTTTPSTGTTTTPSTGTTTTPSTGTTTTPSTGTTTTPDTTPSTGTGMASSSRDTDFRPNADGTFDIFKTSGSRFIYQDGTVEDKIQLFGYRYDKNYNLLWSKEIPRELSEIIGVFLAEDYNFLLVGEENFQESESTEVLRVIKYSKDWVRLGAASLYGANTIDIAGQHGNRSYFLHENLLFIHSGHAMMKWAGDGANHQANMTVVVDITTMTVVDSRTKVSSSSTGYVSHGLEQEVLVDSEGRMVTLDRGDANPRGAYIYRAPMETGNPITEKGTGVMLTTWPGAYASGNVATGSNIRGLVETKDGYITAIIDRNTATEVGAKAYADAYLYFISKTNFTTSGIKINAFSGYTFTGAETIYSVKLVPTSAEGGYVMVLTSEGDYPYTYRAYIATYNSTGGTTPLKQMDMTMENYSTNFVLDGDTVLFASTANLSYGEGTTNFYYVDGTGKTEKFSSAGEDDSYLEGASSWAIELITEAARIGILDDMSDVTSKYQTDITRQEFCRLIVNVYESTGRTAPTGANPFTDTNNSDVISAYLLGIVTGKSATTFAPNDKITRQELAVMVMRTAELFQTITGLSETSSFSDFSTVDSWAKSAVVYAQREGFLAGANGKILPFDYLSCEEAIAVALRLAQKFGDSTESTTPNPTPEVQETNPMYESYLAKIKSIQSQYGVTGNGDFGSATTGLLTAELVDFNGDGNEELVLKYVSKVGDTSTMTYGITEKFVIFSYVNDKVVEIFSDESSAYYGSNFSASNNYFYLPYQGKVLLGTKDEMLHMYNSYKQITLSSYTGTGSMTETENLYVSYYNEDDTTLFSWNINGTKTSTTGNGFPDYGNYDILWAKAPQYTPSGIKDLATEYASCVAYLESKQ